MALQDGYWNMPGSSIERSFWWNFREPLKLFLSSGNCLRQRFFKTVMLFFWRFVNVDVFTMGVIDIISTKWKQNQQTENPSKGVSLNYLQESKSCDETDPACFKGQGDHLDGDNITFKCGRWWGWVHLPILLWWQGIWSLRSLWWIRICLSCIEMPNS